MTQRKYSIEEMDRMRRAIYWIHCPAGPYRQNEEDARLENLLRTYMLNGTEPDELERKQEEVMQSTET